MDATNNISFQYFLAYWKAVLQKEVRTITGRIRCDSFKRFLSSPLSFYTFLRKKPPRPWAFAS
ncbi:MAG TPA: hypothetical protein PLA03_10380, partial [Acidobacteriota bacterium]|nr:hypothetical protein [Acidobacteriota bacterium]